MKSLFNSNGQAFNAEAINETIRRALSSAGLDTTSGPIHNVTETIRRALASGGVPGAPASPASADAVLDIVGGATTSDAAASSHHQCSTALMAKPPRSTQDR